jgi:hypothetical protein
MKDIVEEATAGAKPNSWEARLRHVMSQSNTTSHDSAAWAEDADEQQFVACFSEGGDELSQWRGYGKSIGGYSLGFPSAHLQTIQKRISHSPIIVRFHPCWYDKQAQRAFIAEGVKRVLRHCATARYPVDDSALASFLGAILRLVSSCFKDPSFKDEREWRLVVRILPPRSASVRSGDESQPTRDDIRMDATVLFRKGEYSLVPYITLPVVLDAVLTLSQVVLGPTPLPENARAAAMLLLRPESEEPQIPITATARQRIVCPNVINSSIPFRRV